ncbi:MAG TPA: hypothetical protein VJ691_18395 [Vicinamibacterales bacterium]|nr:hypothetical protein [Vicinamibacterales bacterium]
MRSSNVALAACLALAGAGLVACDGDPSAATQVTATQAPAPPSNPDAVVAEIGGRKVTLNELDAKWEEFDAAERARVTQMLYQNRRNILEVLLGDILIENAAKAANQSVDAFVTQEIAKRQRPITEAEIAQFYEQNKDRAQGRTLDTLRAQIQAFLEDQRKAQARAQLVDDLKSKTAGGVKVLLEPPRYAVAVQDHDPVRGEATAPVTLVEFSDYQ